MSNHQNTTQEIRRIETITLNVKKEIKTLKNRVRAYKGWTTRYRKQKEELKQDNLAISKERDQALEDLQDLKIKQQSLLKTVEEARQAKQLRDQALLQLDEVINKIKQYKKICQKSSNISSADKIYLIKEAEKIFFDEEIITIDTEFNLDENHN